MVTNEYIYACDRCKGIETVSTGHPDGWKRLTLVSGSGQYNPRKEFDFCPRCAAVLGWPEPVKVETYDNRRTELERVFESLCRLITERLSEDC